MKQMPIPCVKGNVKNRKNPIWGSIPIFFSEREVPDEKCRRLCVDDARATKKTASD